MRQPATIEAWELVETKRLSLLVANFARIHMLVTLFDGKPDAWVDFIARQGTEDERRHDLPFAQAMKQKMAEDPKLLDTMRRVVRDVSQIGV